MWADPIVEEIHRTRADITLKAGDNSRALSLAAEEMAVAAVEKFGIRWRSVAAGEHAAEMAAPR